VGFIEALGLLCIKVFDFQYSKKFSIKNNVLITTDVILAEVFSIS
jgi:hypothetical protein